MVSRVNRLSVSVFSFSIGLLLFIFLLTGCGGSTNNSSSASPQATPGVTPTVPAATATVQALMQEMTLMGQPSAKMLGGTTFGVSGQLKNGDTKQHDITVRANLLDGSGKVIATATKFLDNIKGGQIVPFTIKGTTSQPTWSSVQVTVIKISENIGGTGDD
ncbi:MAG: hypothetical protein JO011_09660 [Ktedonobacteraceae bacterium]|nr:hypothetical protein [Ktedonobacteraceae bacterium]